MKRLTECHEKFIVKSNIPVLTSGVVVSLLGHVVVDAELGLGDDGGEGRERAGHRVHRLQRQVQRETLRAIHM